MKKIGQKIFYSPLMKIIIGLIVCGGVVVLGEILISKLLDLLGINQMKYLIIGILAILAIISYSVLYKIYEKRKITEFSLSGIGKNLIVGVIIGTALQSLIILVIYLKGGYTVVSINPILFIIPSLTISFTVAIYEEILFRGIIFRIIEEKLGSYLALFISAFIFGALHLFNPNSSLIVCIGLAIQAGLLLAVAYMYSRNLWFPIAIHFAWNFTQEIGRAHV